MSDDERARADGGRPAADGGRPATDGGRPATDGGRPANDDDRLVGTDVPRREDRALLSGAAEFTDDLDAPGMAHLAFVRSDHAHARVEDVDLSAARATDGVIGAYAWDDLAASDAPCVIPVASSYLDCDVPGHPVLARDRVRYDGQPVAVVVAEDRYSARDGVAAVTVDYDPLGAVVDPVEARAGDAPTIFEDAPDNVALTGDMGDPEATDEAFAAADRTVEVELTNNRLVPSALEPRAALARWDAADEQLTVDVTSQSPHRHRQKLAATLGLPERQIRVRVPRVGGGFGHKGHHHPGEAAAAWATMHLERPVKWTATRSGNYRAGAHGRDHRTTAALAVDDDGTIRGLRAETDAGVGGFGLGHGPAMPSFYGRLLASQYRIPAIHCETRAVFTTTAPVHSYRGAGRPEAIYVTERLVDATADELGLDPAELRRRNLIASDEFPYETPVGATYDSGDYGTALDEALDAVDYGSRRDRSGGRDVGAATGGGGDAEDDGGDAEDAGGTAEDGDGDALVRDADGRYVGVGVACYVESTGGGFESGVVRVHPDGGVTVYAGTHSHGQGHGTTYAQVVADALGVDYDDVGVVEGDTERVPQGTGTFGSRSAIVGGNAVAESAREVREKARRLAAHRLEADPADVTLADGAFHLQGAPDRSVAFAEVASAAYGGGLPDDVEPGLEATTFYEADGTAYAFGAHACVVAVDPETGGVEIERYVAVDDCGEQLNPAIVDGQVHGGVAQGIGQARSEQAVYDADGRLQTDELLRYAVPRAEDLPDVETRATVTPSPHNDLGVKGIGEAGTIAAPPAVVNAVVDALAPLGIRHVDMPLTAERVLAAIADATE